MAELTQNQLILLRQGAADPEGRIDLSRNQNKPFAALSAVLGALNRKGLAVKDNGGQWRVTAAGREVARASSEDQTRLDSLVPNGPATDAPTSDTPANENRASDTSPATDPSTKRGQVLTLLRQEQGACMAEMMAATGWQAHSVRALLSGLRKGGMAVTCTKHGEGPSRYHVQFEAEGTV